MSGMQCQLIVCILVVYGNNRIDTSLISYLNIGIFLNKTVSLKLKCSQYPAMHTNYSCSNCTISY